MYWRRGRSDAAVRAPFFSGVGAGERARERAREHRRSAPSQPPPAKRSGRNPRQVEYSPGVFTAVEAYETPALPLSYTAAACDLNGLGRARLPEGAAVVEESLRGADGPSPSPGPRRRLTRLAGWMPFVSVDDHKDRVARADIRATRSRARR